MRVTIHNIQIITYCTVAVRVCEKHKADPLKMEGMILDIKHLRNSHRPKLLVDDVIMQPNTLYLEVLAKTAIPLPDYTAKFQTHTFNVE